MKNLKKIVLSLIIISYALFLCGCKTVKQGAVHEMTGFSWHASLKSGAEVDLSFDNDHAFLDIKSGGKKVVISGKYLAGEDEFVIFAPDKSQNYGFSYTPRGECLDLKLNGKTITLKKR